MNALVKLTEQTIEGNIKEITFMKIKRDSLLSQLCEVHTNIQNAERANDILEKELIQYVNNHNNKSYADRKEAMNACDRPNVTSRIDG